MLLGPHTAMKPMLDISKFHVTMQCMPAFVTALVGKQCRNVEDFFWSFGWLCNFADLFFSSWPCSHLFAVLKLLIDFNDPEIDTILVRSGCVCLTLLTLLRGSRKLQCQSLTECCDQDH